MKVRLGFVSNSSSASFSVPLSALSPDQLAKIKDYRNTLLAMTEEPEPPPPGEKFRSWSTSCRRWKVQIAGLEEETWVDDYWEIWETDTHLRGDTSMDNLCFDEFLIRLGVPKDAIDYEKDG